MYVCMYVFNLRCSSTARRASTPHVDIGPPHGSSIDRGRGHGDSMDVSPLPGQQRGDMYAYKYILSVSSSVHSIAAKARRLFCRRSLSEQWSVPVIVSVSAPASSASDVPRCCRLRCAAFCAVHVANHIHVSFSLCFSGPVRQVDPSYLNTPPTTPGTYPPHEVLRLRA